ncbi:uncharacterized protein LOC132947972 [Metopolophium dirhodum]|uniref:uncharacterized protein LOC132947972 n=1 Tax=Metopolophium dirhodum TaxID=44670 RepID=UPI0029907A5B|nr:uncharacterized protein LOC132947972 [Metopolophium dirhodum]
MSNIVALETSPKSTIQSVTDNYFEVFDVLQANRAKTLESRDIKSSQAHRRYKSTPNVALQKNSAGANEPETGWPFTTKIMRRYKSMPNMAVQRSNFADDVPDIELPSIASMVELQVSTDSPSTELSVTTPVTAEVGEIEAPSNISSSLPHVRPVEDDVLHLSPTYNTAALQFDGDESINCSAKPSVHQANGIQDMVVTRGGCSDAVTNLTVTAVIPKRRSLWSRTKRFVRRMLCCGAISV